MGGQIVDLSFLKALGWAVRQRPAAMLATVNTAPLGMIRLLGPCDQQLKLKQELVLIDGLGFAPGGILFGMKQSVRFFFEGF